MSTTPPRMPPPCCETCSHVGVLTYCDWIGTWWCVDRTACHLRLEERMRDRLVGELDDDGPSWCGTCDADDAREEREERRFDECHNGDWE